jgi:hypothetical protein
MVVTLHTGLGKVANWEALTDKLNVQFTHHTGPDAPHLYKFVLREDLGIDVGGATVGIQDFKEGLPRRPGDVFLLTRHYMASTAWSQVIAVVPYTEALLGKQPQGVRLRMPLEPKLIQSIFTECEKASRQNLLDPDGRDFLEGWASNSLPIRQRPDKYQYLDWNWTVEEERSVRRDVVHYNGLSAAPTAVRVVPVAPQPDGGHDVRALCQDEVEGGPLGLLVAVDA